MARLLIGHSLRRYFERWAFVRHILWALEGLIFAFLQLLMWLLPTDWASAAGRRALMKLGPRNPKHAKFKRNFAVVFPDKSDEEIDQLATEAWGNLGGVMAEYPHLKRICRQGRGERIEVVLPEDFRSGEDSQRQIIFVSGHLANWEVLAAAVTRLGIPMTATYTPPQNPWLDRMLYFWRQALGCKLVPRDESIRPFIKELGDGRSIGLAVDQRVDSGKMLPLFGEEKLTTLVPARLALRHDCDLVPIRSERLDGARFRATLYPPIVADDPTAPAVEQARQMMVKTNRLLEGWIRERPQDWYCSKRIWPKETHNAVMAARTAPARPY